MRERHFWHEIIVRGARRAGCIDAIVLSSFEFNVLLVSRRQYTFPLR